MGKMNRRSLLTVLFGATFNHKHVSLHVGLITSVVPAFVVEYSACGLFVLPVPVRSRQLSYTPDAAACYLPNKHGGCFHQQLTVVTIGQLGLNTRQGSADDMLDGAMMSASCG